MHCFPFRAGSAVFATVFPFSIKYLFATALVVSSAAVSRAQGYRAPVDIEMSVSGSFGELRNNHFHSGIDIRTQGRTGFRVYAAADGYVSRVAALPAGNGKSVYIDHPDGRTTVYCHLDRFAGRVAQAVEEEQYRRESFRVDITLPPGRIPVKRGQVVGYTGNSGSSGGPHLHYEIRQTAAQAPVDPMDFLPAVKDTQKPYFQNLYLYACDGASGVAGRPGRTLVPMSARGAEYRPSAGDTLRAVGRVALAAHVNDRVNNARSVCGISRLRASCNGVDFYDFEVARVTFETTRYASAHYDHGLSRERGRRVHRLHVLPGNRLPNYRAGLGDGVLEIRDGQSYDIAITATDRRGNASVARLVIVGDARSAAPAAPAAGCRAVWAPRRDIVFDDSALRLSLPPTALYDTLRFDYREVRPRFAVVGKAYQVGDPDAAFAGRASLTLKGVPVPAGLAGKLVAVDCSGDRPAAVGMAAVAGEGLARFDIAAFGAYGLVADTTPPDIRPVNLREGEDMSAARQIRVVVDDDLSGVATYRGEIDGRWVCFDYDPKNKLLAYTFDAHMPPGRGHVLAIEVADAAGNQARREIRFTREPKP